MKSIEGALDLGVQFLSGQRVERLKRVTGSGVDARDCHSIGLTLSPLKSNMGMQAYVLSTGIQ